MPRYFPPFSVFCSSLEYIGFFAGALRIALPAATALLIANIAFGIMSRAAPTLNLFAVGLPAGLLIGFLLLLLNIGHLSTLLTEFLSTTLTFLMQVLGA